MIQKIILCLIVYFFYCAAPVYSQLSPDNSNASKTAALSYTRYIIKFKDKAGTPFSFSNPNAFLSQRAIDRRTRYGITIDSTDLPVTPTYINQVRNVPNVTVLNISRWLNALTIETSDPAALTTINAFAFVLAESPIAARVEAGHKTKLKLEAESGTINSQSARTQNISSNFYNYGTASLNEIHLHNGELLHNIGLRGQGMQIAILDNGFNNYSSATFHAFDSVNNNHQVLDTWDFVAGNQTVTDDGNHGMSCFSIIAANIPGQFIGKAPQANFRLYQTEDNSSEFPIEEVNWACGAERADSSGADVITSSLGYSTFDSAALNHTYADMNGNITLAAIAADLAAKKGLLVFIANGNEGANAWRYLTTPADGDSVLGVGAVDASGNVGNFSSYGPSSDGRIKPDVASVGVNAVLENSSGSVSTGNGTSFATPNIAGLATCLWQGFPEFNNMKIRSALWQSGSISTTPDDRIGYGIPDLKKAFLNLLTDFSTANGSIAGCKTTLNWTSKDNSSMQYVIERKSPGELNYSPVKTVAAQTNSPLLTNHSYQQTDSLLNVQAGTISYRIREVVDTNVATLTAAFIDTVDLVLGSSCVTTGVSSLDPNEKKISILPNPVQGDFIVRVQTNNAISHLVIRVLDAKGSTLAQYSRSKGAGLQDYNISLPRLSHGKYLVSIYDGDHFLLSRPFIKL